MAEAEAQLSAALAGCVYVVNGGRQWWKSPQQVNIWLKAIVDPVPVTALGCPSKCQKYPRDSWEMYCF